VYALILIQGLDNNYHETRKKHQQNAKIPYQFQENSKINPYLPRTFHQNEKDKPPRDNTPL
jgi:hypothetical protein